METVGTALEKLDWQAARQLLLTHQPRFVALVDELEPGDECCFYRAVYPFGSEVLQHGTFYVPSAENGLIALDDPRLDPKLKQQLGYNLGSNPAAILLDNTLELFSPLSDRTLPLGGLISPGVIFGLSRMLTRSHLPNQPRFIWGMTAGARSLFMLPKVAEREKFKRLKRAFDLTVDKPKALVDHWGVFREIANHKNFTQPWQAEMLFFSRSWFDHLEDKRWQPLTCFFYRYAWEQVDYWQNQFVWNLIFSIIQRETNLRTNLFVADTIKCLLAIASGGAPGFAPATDNCAGPIRGLQQAYQDIYGLKNYLPIIMQPARFDIQAEQVPPVYYSLQFPTAIEFGPKSSKHSSLLTDLNDLRAMIEKYLEALRSNQYNIEQTPLYAAIQQVKFDFFHTNVGLYEGIRDTMQLPQEDINLTTALIDAQAKEFPAAAAFLKGCIRLSKLDET